MKNPDHDCLGFCALCHTDIAEYPIVNGAKILKWKKSRREALFKLSNGSVLHVSLCSICDDSLDRRKFMELMESVMKGWEEELKQSRMSDEQKEDYRANYYRLQIVEKI